MVFETLKVVDALGRLGVFGCVCSSARLVCGNTYYHQRAFGSCSAFLGPVDVSVDR